MLHVPCMYFEKERKHDEFYKIFQNKGKHLFKKLFFINKKNFEKGCGSYLFNGKRYVYDQTMYEKQKLLFELSKINNKILEIGNYMGHSILIMLLANPKIHITAIDINDRYARPSLKYLQDQFPSSKINFIKGDSLKILGDLEEKFDLFHIDGTHTHEVISKEFLLLLNLRKKNKVKILFDDIESMLYLKNNLTKNFEITKKFMPASNASNFYVEIKINKNILNQNIKKFKKENFKITFKFQKRKLKKNIIYLIKLFIIILLLFKIFEYLLF